MTQAVDFEQGVSDAWSSIATAVPKFLTFLIILLVAYLLAKALARITNAILERVGFDRAVERGGIRAAMARSRYDASDIVAKLVYYAVLLIGLSLAFGVFGPNPISGYLNAIVSYLPLIFVAIVIIVVAAAIAKAVKDIITGSLGGLSYGPLLANIASGVILALGIIAALNQLNIAENVVNAVLYAALAALVGIAVVGVGGGLIKPMQSRWEDTLTRASDETRAAREQVASQRQQQGRAGYSGDTDYDEAGYTETAYDQEADQPQPGSVRR